MITIILLTTALLLLLLLFACLLANVLVRNYRAHQFFKTKMPQLPVVPNASIFSGHIMSVFAPKNNYKIIEDWHTKLGPNFGYYMGDMPMISTTDIDLIKLVEIDEAHKHIDKALLGLPFREFNEGILQLSGKRWRRMRRVTGSILANHIVHGDQVSSDMESVVDQLAAAMARRVDKSRASTGEASFVADTMDMSQRYTLANNMLIFYQQTGQVDFDCDQDAWSHDIESTTRQLSHPILHLSMAFPFIRPLCAFAMRFNRVGRMMHKILNFIEEATDMRRAYRQSIKNLGPTEIGAKSFVAKHRLVDTIVDAYLDNRINYDNFMGTMLSLFMASVVSTADTITCLMWKLAKHPEIQDKLRRSILEEGSKSEYLDWCIYESIRQQPAVPLTAGRILASDVTFKGQLFPKGAFLMQTIRTIHHDPKIWPEPERYWPERWRDRENFHPAAFLGFGVGARSCIGGKLAQHETKNIIQMILTNYRIEVCEETPDEICFSTPGLFSRVFEKPMKLKFVASRC